MGEELMAAPGDECPECQEGELVIRRNGDTGEEFLGCDEFPDCDYTEELQIWERQNEGGERTGAWREPRP